MKGILCGTTVKTNKEYKKVIRNRMKLMLGVYSGMGAGLFVAGIILWLKKKIWERKWETNIEPPFPRNSLIINVYVNTSNEVIYIYERVWRVRRGSNYCFYSTYFCFYNYDIIHSMVKYYLTLQK